MSNTPLRNQVLCAGILVADHINEPIPALPAPGELVAAGRMYLHTGGCAANVGVDIAKQGLQVAVAGCVGDDVWGRFITDDLAARGVDTSTVAVTSSEQTSQTMILLCEGEDRRFVHTFGANRCFRAGDINEQMLSRSAVLYVGGYLAMPSLLPEELGELFGRARAAGIRTILDVVIPAAYRRGGELIPVLPHTDYFLPNDREAGQLTGETGPPAQAAHLRDLGAANVVITLGEGGLYWSSPAGTGRSAAYEGESIDNTGAGDAFCAGFITGLMRGLDLHGSLQYGSALGHSCVRAIGASTGVFTAPEAEEFLARNPLRLQPA